MKIIKEMKFKNQVSFENWMFSETPLKDSSYVSPNHPFNILVQALFSCI